ncbi:unnamed protein product [Lactuca saligna]|uniref:Uncharacterized protein n=1 Tax=Lactuca saligna TaxID=75948 RepID=A0AA36DZ11_LACSI|nr:unnamed protein product [Lactuca saligna]
MSSTSSSWNQKQQSQKRRHQGLLDVVLSWSLSDILNKDLYKFQVKELPLTFSSTTHYMNSFKYPLLEETHADLLSEVAGISQAPSSCISSLQRIPTGNDRELLYRIKLTGSDYEPQVGDLIALTKVKPKCVADLDRPNSRFLIAFVSSLIDQKPMTIQVLSSDIIESNTVEARRSKAFVVYLTNLTTNMRIWKALNWEGNMSIVQRTLSSSCAPVATNCSESCRAEGKGVIDLELRPAFDSFHLDSSQEAAVISCLVANRCRHQNSIKLIWGPPGTGKTKTMASLLFLLLRSKRRTLTCAPTNIAVVGVAKRVLSLVSDHDLGCDTYGLGDIVLFGNQERMKINDDDNQELLDVFLDNRIDALSNGLSLWKFYVTGMIQFLENPMKEYRRLIVFPKPSILIKTKSKLESQGNNEEKKMTFEEFAMNRFNVFGKKLISCIRSLYTHLPTSVVSLAYAKKLYLSIDIIEMVGESVNEIVTSNKSLKEAFNKKTVSSYSKLSFHKAECLLALKELLDASFIPKPMDMDQLKIFCLGSACLIFCTASSSIKLCTNAMKPIDLVLIDEAAQLKECESAIPLQLRGVQNAVLVGDERQLPSMVQSKICEEAKFGRSLFERLVQLGHGKHLLNIQYRMDPSISQFPNAEFYGGAILDGPNVTNKCREKNLLRHGMYGSYLFIDVDSANEEFDNNHSTKNVVEVAVIAEIVANLFKESVANKQPVTIGCISPYKAQVNAIQAKLGKKYSQKENGSTFTVNVRSVDGFQGSEEDVIIFSTVRCNQRGSVGFLSNRQRANVALTRARHCLWIVGNKETMIKSGSVWTALVSDAEDRGCVYSASENKNLAQAMVQAMVELGQFGLLLKKESLLFKEAKWKVNFDNTFLERMERIQSLYIRKQVVSLLVKLSDGWRQHRKSNRNNFNDTPGIYDILETYNLDGRLYLVWSVDIVYENSLCAQVLKVWDILPLSQIQQCAKSLEQVFGNYTLDMIKRCQTKCSGRNQALPITWHEDLGNDLSRDLASQFDKLCFSAVSL